MTVMLAMSLTVLAISLINYRLYKNKMREVDKHIETLQDLNTALRVDLEKKERVIDELILELLEVKKSEEIRERAEFEG